MIKILKSTHKLDEHENYKMIYYGFIMMLGNSSGLARETLGQELGFIKRICLLSFIINYIKYSFPST